MSLWKSLFPDSGIPSGNRGLVSDPPQDYGGGVNIRNAIPDQLKALQDAVTASKSMMVAGAFGNFPGMASGVAQKAPPPPAPKCQSCRHWHKTGDTQIMGQCRYFAPTVQWHPKEGAFVTVWPETIAHQSCGSFATPDGDW